MRNITDVLGLILLQIPSTQVDLRRRLDGLFRSACFAAPEMHTLLWEDGTWILSEHLPARREEYEDWQKHVAEVWVGQPWDDIGK